MPSKVLQLLEAVESLKEGIVTGDSVALGKVEQAVGKVAQCIDVYLILAVRAAHIICPEERSHASMREPLGVLFFGGQGKVLVLDTLGFRRSLIILVSCLGRSSMSLTARLELLTRDNFRC